MLLCCLFPFFVLYHTVVVTETLTRKKEEAGRVDESVIFTDTHKEDNMQQKTGSRLDKEECEGEGDCRVRLARRDATQRE